MQDFIILGIPADHHPCGQPIVSKSDGRPLRPLRLRWRRPRRARRLLAAVPVGNFVIIQRRPASTSRVYLTTYSHVRAGAAGQQNKARRSCCYLLRTPQETVCTHLVRVAQGTGPPARSAKALTRIFINGTPDSLTLALVCKSAPRSPHLSRAPPLSGLCTLRDSGQQGTAARIPSWDNTRSTPTPCL